MRPVPQTRSEGLSRLLKLAGPIVFAQLCFFGMNTTDTIVAGRLSADVLAGVALGGTIMMIGLTFLLGYGLAVSPLVAHRVGAREPASEIAQLNFSATALLVVCWSSLGLMLWLLPPLLLDVLPVEPAVRENAVSYLRAVSFGTPFMGLFFALRNVMEGLGFSRPIMWLGMLALLINIPLDIALMTGWGPIPAMGAAGCGLATALVQMMLGLSMWLCFLLDHRFRAYKPRGGMSRDKIGEVLKLGTPIALALASEHALFAVGGLLMTRFGTEALAAAQIALNFTGMMFMIALGMGQASSVMVGQSVGRKDVAGVRLFGRLGFETVAVVSGLVAVFMILNASRIASWYTSDAAVQAVAMRFIQIAGVFHVVDALQAVGSGVLRGLKDTRYVLWATSFSYWGIGGTAFIWFFVFADAQAITVWWIYCAALASAAVLLGGRFFARTMQLKASMRVEGVDT